MLFRQRQSTGATAGSTVIRSGGATGLTRESRRHGSAVAMAEQPQGSSKNVTESSWERFTALAPQETETAVTYRVGRRPAGRGASAAHPQSADPSHAQVAGSHGTGSPEPDHYTLLGVEQSAPGEQIERVYRRQVALIHPDKFAHDPMLCGQAQEKLKQLNTAIAVLRDPARRARYDAKLLVDTRTPLARRLQGSTPRYLR